MKPFRLVTNGIHTYVQEYKKEMLFGSEWVTILSFIGCKNRCERIVELLNECATISNNRQSK